MHPVTKIKYFSSRLAIVFAQSCEARCQVENEDVVGAAPTGDAPTTSEWWTRLLPAKVSYISDLMVEWPPFWPVELPHSMAQESLIRYVRLSQFSQLSFMQYMELCVFSLPIYLMMIMGIRVLYHIIIIKSEVWPICHCLGFGHETVICTACLSISLCCDLFCWH